MFDNDSLRTIFFIAQFLVLVLLVGKVLLFSLEGGVERETQDISTAKPIYQQRIGDDTEPDILIIYEAEVDGVKVYPSVIKEAE